MDIKSCHGLSLESRSKSLDRVKMSHVPEFDCSVRAPGKDQTLALEGKELGLENLSRVFFCKFVDEAV